MKKNPRSPRAKRMKRAARLASARDKWLGTYQGKNIVRGYRKHFGVDWICAVKELEILGIRIDPEYKQRLLRTAQCAASARKQPQVKSASKLDYSVIDQDEHFAYIAGYTEAGFAYGVTWEEWEKLEYEDSNQLPSQITRSTTMTLR
jgi:hypothetical protein